MNRDCNLVSGVEMFKKHSCACHAYDLCSAAEKRRYHMTCLTRRFTEPKGRFFKLSTVALKELKVCVLGFPAPAATCVEVVFGWTLAPNIGEILAWFCV